MATQQEAAEHLDLSSRQIKNLIDQGVLPQAPRGQIDLDEYRFAYIRWQRARLHGRKESDLTIDEERKRLIAGQADKVELEVKQMSGELVPEEFINQLWMDKVMGARSTLMALPTKIAPVVMSASTIRDVEDFARDEIYRALNELADCTKANRPGDSRSVATTTKTDDQRMGASA